MHEGVDLPFRIQATTSLTPDGKIRVHPPSVRVEEVGVGRVIRLFGMHLQSLLKIQPGHGAAIDGDDFILDPTAMLPAPRIQGRLTLIGIRDGRLVQSFGDSGAPRTGTTFRESARYPNYVYFRGGTLRFGKLTMADAEMVIVDEAPKSPFVFFTRGLQRAASGRLLAQNFGARPGGTYAGFPFDRVDPGEGARVDVSAEGGARFEAVGPRGDAPGALSLALANNRGARHGLPPGSPDPFPPCVAA